MAEDIKISWNDDLLEGDLQFQNDDLVREIGLESAVLISLFTDKRADEDDDLDNINDLRGWWGDQISEYDDDTIGSKLWLLERAKTTTETLIKVQEYAYESLKWMEDDGVVAKVEIDVERFGDPGNDRLGLHVKLLKIDGTTEAFKFDDLWTGQFSEV